jgi:glycosyltransferase involved in cell wall biosynthesis
MYLPRRAYFRGIRYFLTTGDANEAFYRHYAVPPSKFIRMHFPIDRRAYDRAFEQRQALRAETRARHGIAPGEKVLATVGKLIHYKRQADLLDALARLEAGGNRCHLFVLGDGPDRERLERHASRLRRCRVHFTGFVPPEELPAYYAASDALVHPSAIDAHPLAVSEAIYMGCPVLVSDRCGSYGPTDDVQPDRNGWVFRMGDAADLGGKIERLLADDALLARFSAASMEISRQFQQRAHAGVLEALIAALRPVGAEPAEAPR